MSRKESTLALGQKAVGVYSRGLVELLSSSMTRFHKAARSTLLLSSPVEIHEVDGVALSDEEVKIAKRLLDKLAIIDKGGVIDFRRASKWSLRRTRLRKK
jgi:hypothetical protein